MSVDHVLASIDGAIEDYVSADAVRWVPPEKREEVDPKPKQKMSFAEMLQSHLPPPPGYRAQAHLPQPTEADHIMYVAHIEGTFYVADTLDAFIERIAQGCARAVISVQAFSDAMRGLGEAFTGSRIADVLRLAAERHESDVEYAAFLNRRYHVNLGPEEEDDALYERVRERIAAYPGVERVGRFGDFRSDGRIVVHPNTFAALQEAALHEHHVHMGLDGIEVSIPPYRDPRQDRMKAALEARRSRNTGPPRRSLDGRNRRATQ